jgi:hypothetical protein
MQLLHSMLICGAAGLLAIPRAQAQGVRPDSRGAFALEALGGAAGSLVGFGIVGLTANCGVEDLACVITTVGAGGALGALGATIGTSMVARSTGSRRSVAGAAVGSLVGTGVGLGVHWVLNRNSDRNLGDKIVLPIFVISQGVFAAMGSRLVGAAQGMR